MNTIYLLIDPRTAAVRYVGVTTQEVRVRVRRHLAEARRGGTMHRHAWLRTLLDVGLRPLVVIAQEGVAREREKFWIAHYRAAGCNLTNLTDGGDGLVNPSAETRARIAAGATGHKHSEEVRQRIAAASRAHWEDPDYRRRVIDGHIGQKRSPETCARIKAGQHASPIPRGGYKWTHGHSDATKAKISVAKKGQPGKQHSDAAKAQISRANAGAGNGQAKLSEAQVRAIRAAWAGGGITQGEIAAEFHVSRNQIHLIIRRKVWQHLKE